MLFVMWFASLALFSLSCQVSMLPVIPPIRVVFIIANYFYKNITFIESTFLKFWDLFCFDVNYQFSDFLNSPQRAVAIFLQKLWTKRPLISSTECVTSWQVVTSIQKTPLLCPDKLSSWSSRPHHMKTFVSATLDGRAFSFLQHK